MERDETSGSRANQWFLLGLNVQAIVIALCKWGKFVYHYAHTHFHARCFWLKTAIDIVCLIVTPTVVIFTDDVRNSVNSLINNVAFLYFYVWYICKRKKSNTTTSFNSKCL